MKLSNRFSSPPTKRWYLALKFRMSLCISFSFRLSKSFLSIFDSRQFCVDAKHLELFRVPLVNMRWPIFSFLCLTLIVGSINFIVCLTFPPAFTSVTHFKSGHDCFPTRYSDNPTSQFFLKLFCRFQRCTLNTHSINEMVMVIESAIRTSEGRLVRPDLYLLVPPPVSHLPHWLVGGSCIMAVVAARLWKWPCWLTWPSAHL